MSGQLWAVSSEGGYFYSLNLSDELREAVQPMTRFRQLADVKDASQQGKKKGDTFTYDVVNDITTTGGTLTETSTMPEGKFTITQGTVTINEYGQAVPYSGKLEALSKFDVRKPIMQALRNDTAKTLDRATHAQFNLTPLRVVPASSTSTTSLALTTNGTATVTNSIAFRSAHAKLIVDLMKERNIPPYMGNDYMAIAWPSTYRAFKNDLETLHQYVDAGLTMIMNGEIGRYEATRYVEQTNIGKGVSNNGTAWSAGLSDWIFFFGEDNVAEAIAVPEEMRAKLPSDYGRSKGVAWYYLGGFGIVHRSDPAQARIVKWDSAA